MSDVDRAKARSACSIAIGKGVIDTPPGSVQALQLVVPDVHAARAELLARGVEVSDVQEFPWGSFVFFRDPDGNGWAVPQLPSRDRAHPRQCRESRHKGGAGR